MAGRRCSATSTPPVHDGIFMEQRLVAGFEARGQTPSSVMAALSRVLHLVPPNGGGVDRFVRDLCAHRPADWILHVSDDQCVVECAQR